MGKDPVCGTLVDENTATRRSEFAGRVYLFCSAECKDKFDYDPKLYVREPVLG